MKIAKGTLLNGLEATNKYFENYRGDIIYAEPNFIYKGFFSSTVNDPLFNSQLPQICGLDAQCPQQELRERAIQGKLTSAQMDPLLEPRPAEELFDVDDDPHQINNIAELPALGKVLKDLRKLMDEWQQLTGDTVPSLEEATPDRYDRRTGKPLYGTSGRPVAGVIPGQTVGASKNQ